MIHLCTVVNAVNEVCVSGLRAAIGKELFGVASKVCMHRSVIVE